MIQKNASRYAYNGLQKVSTGGLKVLTQDLQSSAWYLVSGAWKQHFSYKGGNLVVRIRPDTEGIKVDSFNVGGTFWRKIHFYPYSGEVFTKRVKAPLALDILRREEKFNDKLQNEYLKADGCRFFEKDEGKLIIPHPSFPIPHSDVVFHKPLPALSLRERPR